MTTIAESRPDLVHPFQCQPGRGGECSYYHTWLGGQVKCGMAESDPIHRNGPHLLRERGGEIAYCAGPGVCWACVEGWPSCEFLNYGRVIFPDKEASRG